MSMTDPCTMCQHGPKPLRDSERAEFETMKKLAKRYLAENEAMKARAGAMTPVYDLAIRLVNECPILILGTVCKHNDNEGCDVACIAEDLARLVKEKS